MNQLKETMFGMAVGFVTMCLCLPVVLWIMSLAYSYEFAYFWKQFMNYSVYTSKYLSLACIPNLFWFYFFLNRERWTVARGVIFSVLVLVPFAIYVNF
ncbi:MAG: hypothetical protein RLZZ68_815 [Bacteroidota bacterium]|jgi:hypothetical protein|nr:hypothetical protein [Flavobacteriia bacterium]NBP28267.1 hypothetical protein [Flavobacteriia bacterium]